MNLEIDYNLSLYEELKLIHKSKKSEINLVQNTLDDKIYIKRILKEYTLDVYKGLKNINSINIPKIYECFEHEDQLIIIEEFINGHTLQEILEKKEKLDEDIVIKYMISLCDALEQIHNLNPPIIHRDIKPANIIISNDNVLKLIDFDISRTYKSGENLDTTLLGTKGYASPEQFGFDQTDCRSDIYAMGVMMNVLTTGKHIKEKKNIGKLKDIIERCTKISAEDRYKNISQLKKELLKLINNENKKINLEKTKFYKHIPGYRSGKLINEILATLWYLTLSIGLISFNNISELIGNIIMIIMFLSIFFMYTNFLDIKSKLPFLRSDLKVKQIFGYIIYTFIIMMVLGLML